MCFGLPLFVLFLDSVVFGGRLGLVNGSEDFELLELFGGRFVE